MKRSILLLFLLTLFTLAAVAQDLPSAPQPQPALFAAATPSMIQPVVAVPHNPKHVGTKQFWALTAISSAITVADIELTQNCLATIKGCYEKDPVYGKNPSRARMYAINIPIDAAIGYLGYKALTRRRSRFWMVPQAILAATHFSGIVSNLSVR